MSERTVVENRQVGYHWFISIEKELRTESGAKYPDKTVVHASLEGNELSFETCKILLENARQVIADRIAKVEQPDFESLKNLKQQVEVSGQNWEQFKVEILEKALKKRGV